ncbi:MAG: YceI family protein [Candidatus Pacebacteria bacterium]|nr:YceI family protein [Candidatus Paceibacterota bacterium]
MKKWNIDAGHSEVGFTVKHLLISTVRGRFGVFEGELVAEDESFNNAKLSFTALASSITTNNSARDAHLQSPDFFDSVNNPNISFVSKSFSKDGENKYKVEGDLTMRGVTKPITVDAIFNGAINDAYGKRVLSFDVSGIIKRTDFGVSWNAVLEAGGLSVSEEVTLEATIELKEE